MRGLKINIVEGNTAPRYDSGYETQVSHVTITEKGTKAELPLVDFVAKDKDGKKVMFVLTGREVIGIAAAVQGINIRNHGTADP